MTAIPSRRELLAWLVAFTVVITFAVSTITNRAVGSDDQSKVAPETTAQTETLPQTETTPPAGTPRVVYIATGLNYPDALGAGATAAMGMGPILFVSTDSIPGPTYTELNRLKPNQIVIVGGTSAVSDTVKTALENLSFSPTVTRIAGTNRYDTAAQLSASVFNTTGFYPRVAATTGSSSNAGTGNDGTQVALTMTDVTDIPGIYTVWATADTWLDSVSGTDTLHCYIEVNDTKLPGSDMYITLSATSNMEENCTTQGYYIATTADAYNFELVISLAGTSTKWWDRSLIAQFTPYYPGS